MLSHITEETIVSFEQSVYYDCMQSVLKAEDTFTFIPAVKPSTPAEEKLLQDMSKETHDRFQEALLQKWTEAKARCPAFMRNTLPEEPPLDCLQECYYVVLQSTYVAKAQFHFANCAATNN